MSCFSQFASNFLRKREDTGDEDDVNVRRADGDEEDKAKEFSSFSPSAALVLSRRVLCAEFMS